MGTTTLAALSWISSAGRLVSSHGHVVGAECPGNVDHDPRHYVVAPNGTRTTHADKAAAMAFAEANR